MPVSYPPPSLIPQVQSLATVQVSKNCYWPSMTAMILNRRPIPIALRLSNRRRSGTLYIVAKQCKIGVHRSLIGMRLNISVAVTFSTLRSTLTPSDVLEFWDHNLTKLWQIKQNVALTGVGKSWVGF